MSGMNESEGKVEDQGADKKTDAQARVASPTKFIVCVDKNDASQVALRFACIKAMKCNGLVEILHIMEPPQGDALLGVAETMRAEARAAAEVMVQELCREANEIAGIMPSILLREGKVGEELMKAAMEDPDAKMLVLGVNPGGSKRGRLIAHLSTQMGEALLIPVLLVPGNLTDQQIEELS